MTLDIPHKKMQGKKNLRKVQKRKKKFLLVLLSVKLNQALCMLIKGTNDIPKQAAREVFIYYMIILLVNIFCI